MGGETVDSISSANTLGAPSDALQIALPVVAADSYVQLDEYARGGLGRIIRAKDQRTGRIVAIKEMLTSHADAAARFVREAMVTANLQHPAIVPVYEVGRWPDGKPFYAMKLVQGRALNDAIAAAKDLDGRLALISHVAAVADALAYAHGERVIHRDLKPHNVLCGAFGETVVIDWGLARRIDEADLAAPDEDNAAPGETSAGAIMGTPSYMAPEQARGDRADERTDVYAIGAILYHVLAGRPPHVGRDIDALLAQVKSAPPPPLPPSVPPELRAIADRALARDAAARYPSAAELASDLRRFMTGQLVLAHHYTRRERFMRFVARHRAALAVAAAALAIVAVGATIAIRNIIVARGEATASRDEATASRDEARRRLVASYIDRAGVELVGAHPDRALAYAIAAGEQTGLTPELRLMAGHALAQLPAVRTWPETGGIVARFVPGTHDLLLGAADVVRWDAAANAVRWRLPGVPRNQLVVLDHDMFAYVANNALVFASFSDGRSVEVVSPPDTRYHGLVADGRWLAVIAPARIDLFDVASRKPVAAIPFANAMLVPRIAPDGEHLAVTAKLGTMSIIDRTGKVVTTFEAEVSKVESAGDEIVYAPPPGANGVARLVVADWHGKPRLELSIGSSMTHAFAVDTRAGLLAVGLTDGVLQMRSLATGNVLWQTTIGDQVQEIRFDGDKVRVLGTSLGVLGFDAASGIEVERVRLPGMNLVSSEDTEHVAITTIGLGVAVVALSRSEITPIAPTAARVSDFVTLPNGSTIAATDDGELHELRDGRVVRTLATGIGVVWTLARVADGRLITVAKDGPVIVRDANGRELRRFVGMRASPSPDGQLIALATAARKVELWDLAAGTFVRTLGSVDDSPRSLRWSSDGKRIAANSDAGHAIVWSVDGNIVRNISAGILGASNVALSRDGKWLVRGGEPADTLYALDGGTDRKLPGVPGAALAVGFSPDEKTVLLAGIGFAGTWDVATGQPRLRLATNSWITSATFLADGRYIIGGTLDRQVHVWNAETGAELLAFTAPASIRRIFVDGTRVGVLTARGALTWNVPAFAGTLDELRALARCRVDVEVSDAHVRPRTIDVAACAAAR